MVGSSPRNRWRAAARSGARLLPLGALLLTPAPGVAAEEASPDARQRAAEAFDAGLRHIEAAEYEAAARAFLRADAAVPSSDALGNALVAASRAGDHLLVVEAAERALERRDGDPGLTATARRHLAQSARHLARLDVTCAPPPCAIELDGAPADPGQRFVLPGTHTLVATGPDGARAEETQTLVAGATYRLELRPAAPEASAAGVAAPAAPPAPAADRAAVPAGGWSPAVFYAGLGVTAAIGGVWAWSGLDTLSANRDLGDDFTRDEWNAVRSKVRRTDVLLGASVLSAAATAYIGLALVDWGGGEAAVVPASGGGVLVTRGRF